MTRPFVPFPDPGLRRVAAPVAAVTDEVHGHWDAMLAAMYAMPGRGVGLAAPQIGIGLRLAVLDCSDRGQAPVRLANPEIVALADEQRTWEEASPNLPGVSAPVSRPVWAEVRYLGPEGTEAVQVFRDLWATSVQHQIDHLDGLLFFDRLPPLRKRRVLAAYRKSRGG